MNSVRQVFQPTTPGREIGMDTEKSLRDLYDNLRIAQGHGQKDRAVSSSEDPFIVKLMQLLLSYGVDLKASDIHIEPTAVGARVRYRVDGILHEMLSLPPEISEPFIRSVKIRANMATDVIGRSKPQDGRIDFGSNGPNAKKIDLRISSFPTLFGDVLAIRILDRSAPLLELEQLGFTPSTLKEFERLIHRPNGLFLVTGPANSGKTTTLYAALNKLRSPRIKVVTLEDPVEYQVEGIDQGQINPAIGVTFASGLRSILRQDSNIILVGEIRDKETADIAIRAALTGHLVLSTMHTRNSLGAATRLIDMQVEPHLIVASVSGVMAQRLVRALCTGCRAPDLVAARTFTALWKREMGSALSESELAQVSKGAGCTNCHTTGYRGRLGIFELLIFTDELKQLVLDRASGQLYRSANVVPGMVQTMLLDGLQKVVQGLTTVEEILRVTGETDEV